jgi:type I restriction-modification system DNA methylase subunit
MALFQKSVLNKYLKGLDESFINQQYEVFKKYFLHPEIQDNIRSSKEEQFQATFLNELFVKVFGYTLNPNQNYNLTTEFKNVKNAKKADGAILQNGKAVGVIELKGMNTTSLDKVEGQAFGYKNNQPDAVYVITSNFEKLRFYIDDAVSFEEFNLFHLSLERFKILYLCLAKDNIFIGLPKQMKDTSLAEEENITKKLYKDYSTFKNDLFNSIVKLNPQFDKLLLFKKTQKLLDRFLFIFFSEDGGLLPPNSIKAIVDQWVQLRDELDEYTPLYNRFKKYFGYMDTGYKGKKHDIFAYNGGLFAADEILDTIKIDDTLLYTHTQKLSRYDFKSEVDVNILGHIFEHSLNEIEEVTAELAGQTIDKSKTKRKKDGVFYTPKYITKYIVENTVGKLCEDKKTELNIDEAEYNKDRKGRNKATLKKLKTQLETYRNWLLGITICDPACGSGAFLNQALEFLIEEHTYIDELETKLLGGSFIFPNIENAILENNLFGVDINEESVDIAKLSLWLRSAKPNRKLNSLNSNIKCGNSLIDDVNIAGDKAFDWKSEFPKVFEKGGFDVIIGNPPYLVVKGGRWISGFQYEKAAINYLKDYFLTASQQINTYILFIELGIKLTKRGGYISQITPNTFLANEYSKDLRKFLIEKSTIIELFNSGIVFTDASVETAILTYKNIFSETANTKIKLSLLDDGFMLNLKDIVELTSDYKFLINTNKETLPLLKKLNNYECIIDYAKVWRGLTTGNDKKYLSSLRKDDNYKKVISGSEVGRFYHTPSVKFVNYIPDELDRPRDERIFLLGKKLISKFVGNRLTFCFDSQQHYVVNTACSVEILNDNVNPLFLLLILNSKLINFYFQQVFSDSRSTFPIMKSGNIEALPIKMISVDKQVPFSNKAEEIIKLSEVLYTKKIRFLKRLTDNLNIEKPSKKLKSFYDYDFKTFVSELKKKKVILSLTQQDEWEDYFKAYTTEINTLQAEINQIDREIDKMVYELYGLTEDEIKIVESA